MKIIKKVIKLSKETEINCGMKYCMIMGEKLYFLEDNIWYDKNDNEIILKEGINFQNILNEGFCEYTPIFSVKDFKKIAKELE